MFYKLLKTERIKKGLSQMALAKILGISQQTIGSWETGRTSPDLETLVKIAKFFNVSTDYLLGISDSFDKKNTEELECFSSDDIDIFNKYFHLPNDVKRKIAMRIEIAYDDMLEAEKSKLNMREIS